MQVVPHAEVTGWVSGAGFSPQTQWSSSTGSMPGEPLARITLVAEYRGHPGTPEGRSRTYWLSTGHRGW